MRFDRQWLLKVSLVVALLAALIPMAEIKANSTSLARGSV